MNELGAVEWIRSALERFELPLIRYAARITGNVDQARDVVQDTFLRLCATERTKVEGHLAAWLYTVCRNRAFDVSRKERRMVALNEATAASHEDGAPPPSDAAERAEAQSLILTCLGTLPEKQQEVLRLKFQDAMSYREISQITGQSVAVLWPVS